MDVVNTPLEADLWQGKFGTDSPSHFFIVPNHHLVAIDLLLNVTEEVWVSFHALEPLKCYLTIHQLSSMFNAHLICDGERTIKKWLHNATKKIGRRAVSPRYHQILQYMKAVAPRTSRISLRLISLSEVSDLFLAAIRKWPALKLETV